MEIPECCLNSQFVQWQIMVGKSEATKAKYEDIHAHTDSFWHCLPLGETAGALLLQEKSRRPSRPDFSNMYLKTYPVNIWFITHKRLIS